MPGERPPDPVQEESKQLESLSGGEKKNRNFPGKKKNDNSHLDPNIWEAESENDKFEASLGYILHKHN